ncbi:MAG: tetratricopeptide repeat protein [Terracidiphilus sp.]|nr:tetratricopeptide repeat protein [Terracidiphilus sp.]
MAVASALPAPPVRSAEQELALGLQARKAGHMAEAEVHFRGCKQLEPDSIPCTVQHADVLANLNQPFDSIIEVESFLKRNPESVPVLKTYALLLEKVAADRREAEKVWRKAATLAPNDAEVWHLLGAMLAESQRGREAVDAYAKAVALSPDDPLLLAGLAYSHGLTGQDADAEREFQKALRLNEQTRPPGVEVLMLYGSYLREAGKAADSVVLLSRAVSLKPGIWRVRLERAKAYERLGKYGLAETDALQAMKLTGDRRDIRLLLIRIYRQQGAVEKVSAETEAIRRLTEVENARMETSRELHAALKTAETAVDRGDCASAIAPYQKITALMQTFYEAWFPLGVCLSQAGRPVEAETALKKYLSFQPLSGDGRTALGLLYLTQARFAEARTELRKALDLDPAAVEAAAGLARVLVKLKDDEGALPLADRAIALQPADQPADLYLLAAEISLRLGDRQKAKDYCARGLKLHPTDTALQEFLSNWLLGCVESIACRQELGTNLQGQPYSAAYLKAATQALILVNPRDAGTEQMVLICTRRLPGDADALILEARWRAMRNEHVLGIQAAERALALRELTDSQRVAALTLSAESTLALGERDKGHELFAQAWAANSKAGICAPASAVSWAALLEREQRIQESARVLNAVLQASPRNVGALLARARQQLRAGDSVSAISGGLAALKYSAGPAQEKESHSLLASAYQAAGRTTEAQLHAGWISAQP